MTDTIQKLVEYIPTSEYGFFTAGEALVAGFVELSGTALTLVQSGASGTKRPIGVAVTTYSAADTVSIVVAGVVNLIADTALSAGQPIFPADTAGRVIATGAADTSGVAKLSSLGTVIKGASASAIVQVLLSI